MGGGADGAFSVGFNNRGVAAAGMGVGVLGGMELDGSLIVLYRSFEDKNILHRHRQSSALGRLDAVAQDLGIAGITAVYPNGEGGVLAADALHAGDGTFEGDVGSGLAHRQTEQVVHQYHVGG